MCIESKNNFEMGFSKLKIPKICEFCEKPFEAKTVTTRFCSKYCSEKEGKRQKRIAKDLEEKQSLLEKSVKKIAEIQTRPYISVSEAVVLFGISKDTIRRLIKNGKIPAHNFGERLTRVSKLDIELLFTSIELPPKKEEKSKPNFEVGNCYTISEISEKFHADPGTVNNVIRRNKIPTKKVGSFVYVPKDEIDKIFANR
ncbi:helix-turn-helix domain-containing protein [Chryseobacterium sp. SC28]|uniref:helix-turn-helix domain-containing protein n=1 Tax=Chryseobacterium sp. SC28 TaxID=2268028 RepID=UPI001E547C32|nr:helix-turn-helix domain-containing protein [Chryseobacterium sp. SC28]